MENKKSVVKEVWIGLALVLIASYFRFIACNQLNKNAAQYPKYIFTLFLLMSLALTIQGVYFSLKPSSYKNKDVPITPAIIKYPMIVFAAVVLYLVMFYYIGFFVATTLFIPLIMLLYGERKVLNIVAVTVCLDAFIYVVFCLLLSVRF
ncbi:MAG: tripartite tricarboxylate transporter TctB family protein [Oscillospiraceae bacterium]